MVGSEGHPDLVAGLCSYATRFGVLSQLGDRGFASAPHILRLPLQQGLEAGRVARGFDLNPANKRLDRSRARSRSQANLARAVNYLSTSSNQRFNRWPSSVRLVKVLYVLAIVILIIGAVVFLISGLVGAEGFLQGLFIFLLTPIIAFAYLLAVRIWLELIIVVFRIGETATEVRDLLASRPQG